jgi:hypothetical protein
MPCKNSAVGTLNFLRKDLQCSWRKDLQCRLNECRLSNIVPSLGCAILGRATSPRHRHCLDKSVSVIAQYLNILYWPLFSKIYGYVEKHSFVENRLRNFYPVAIQSRKWMVFFTSRSGHLCLLYFNDKCVCRVKFLSGWHHLNIFTWR